MDRFSPHVPGPEVDLNEKGTWLKRHVGKALFPYQRETETPSVAP
jgi:hypothetical protein